MDVQSKYVYAFQESVQKSATLFPTQSPLYPLRGEYEDVRDKLFKQLDKRQESTNTVLDYYKKRCLTVESLAYALHRPPIAIWGMLAGGHYCKLFACSGKAEDYILGLELLRDKDGLMLELTSVLAFAQLGLLQKLPLRFKTLYTTQAVIDEVIREVTEHTFGKEQLTIGKIGEHYVKDEISKEQIEKNRVFFEGIRDFLLTKVETVPAISVLDKENSHWRDMQAFLGKISTTCVLAAQERHAILLSDDEMLRVLARNEAGVAGVWTQTVLQELLRSGHITQSEYIEAVAKLIWCNYTFVSSTADVLMWILTKTNFHITREVTVALDGFRGPECTLESAAGVLADVIKKVWLETVLYENKMKILDVLLETIVAGRPIKQAIELFKAVILNRLSLLPTVGIVIMRYIDNWYKQRVNREGLQGFKP